jgi:zinc/manganese transport system substrate-binding protein
MKTLLRSLTLLLLALGATSPAFGNLKVATSLSDLASVAQFVGGKHVEARSLCKGYEDPHFVPAKPSLMKAIQKADVFVSVGLELDGGWLPLVLPGSRNPKIQPGKPGFVDASEGVNVLEKPVGTVSRAEGDIHPLGNPHYYVDPENLKVVADHLARVFSQLDPANAADYGANAKAFDARIDSSLVRWEAELAPYKGASVVTYHKNFIYFADRFGLKLFGNVEEKPGIPPSPRHIAEMAGAMKQAGVKVVLYQPYYKADVSKGLAQRADGVAVEIATEAGGLPGTDDVFSKFDVLVSSGGSPPGASTCWPGGSSSWIWPWPRSRLWGEASRSFSGRSRATPACTSGRSGSPSWGRPCSASCGTGTTRFSRRRSSGSPSPWPPRPPCSCSPTPPTERSTCRGR